MLPTRKRIELNAMPRSENFRETVVHHGETLLVKAWRGKGCNYVYVSSGKRVEGFAFPKSVAFGAVLRNRAVERFAGRTP